METQLSTETIRIEYTALGMDRASGQPAKSAKRVKLAIRFESREKKLLVR